VSGFEEFPDTSVGDMVLMEASLVANEDSVLIVEWPSTTLEPSLNPLPAGRTITVIA
jgi:hypothetical protein